jgi:hypothetical protein
LHGNLPQGGGCVFSKTGMVEQLSTFHREDPLSGILTVIAFAVRATAHTVMQATPMQLVFRRDVLFDIQHCGDMFAT